MTRNLASLLAVLVLPAFSLIAVLAWSQDRAQDQRGVGGSNANQSDYRNLDLIFSRIENDLEGEASLDRFESSQAKLERLAKAYELKAKSGDRDAQFKIGAMYLEGLGVRANYGGAERWFSMAGGRDHPLAQLAHGRFCLKCRDDDSRNNMPRDATIRAIGEIGPRAAKAVPSLEQEIRCEGSSRLIAAVALGQIGQPGVPILIEAIASKDVVLRRGAVEGLLRAGEAARPAIPALTEALKDEDPGVRNYAQSALKRLRSKEEQK